MISPVQLRGLVDGLSDSRKEFGGVLLFSAEEAEGDIGLASDLIWLAEEGFLS